MKDLTGRLERLEVRAGKRSGLSSERRKYLTDRAVRYFRLGAKRKSFGAFSYHPNCVHWTFLVEPISFHAAVLSSYSRIAP
jgi:hypothetical protein